MKARHKRHPDVVVRLDANARIHWLAGLSKDEWELVPEEHWQDVTEECDLRMDGKKQVMDHVSTWGMILQVAEKAPYRLVKRDRAFIVERKVD